MILPVVFLLLGILFGRFFSSPEISGNLDFWIVLTLSIVVFTAGIDVGSKKIILRKLAQYRLKVLLIPLGTIFGSLLGGALLGIILGIPLNEAAAVSAGFGYYSLSTGILTGLGDAGLGALAFVSNIFRELLALMLTPVAAKYLNPYCAIAPGGATTMDTTLGIISHCTNEEVTAIAMINGVILSALVPLLVPFLYRL